MTSEPPRSDAADAPDDRQEPRDDGPRLTSVVIFVNDLDRSARFYCGLLKMEIAARESTALLLAGSGNTVVLRGVGPLGEHPLGAVGVQYAVWTAHDADDLRRCEHFLKEQSAHIATKSGDGRTVVEGRDPSGLPVMVAYPGPDLRTLRKIMTRVYAW